MSSLYTKPLRVYILLAALAIWGVISGLQLPISLFPNSNQITIAVDVPYGPFSSQQFFEAYGEDIEVQINGFKIDGVGIKELRADYGLQNVNYVAVFEWGANPQRAVVDLDAIVRNKFSSAPEEIRRGINVYSWSQDKGFFAVSFYSPMRSLDDLYQILEPLIKPVKSQIEDAGSFSLWNPNQKEVTISLLPEKLAQYEVTTIQVQRAIQNSVLGLTGGSLRMGEKTICLIYLRRL